ncbi:MAG: hypothetical protein GOV00_02530 [Candidatus Altiarchaeota archaeon]|nr:hypothetical protein [Candidatus Altiarchaeota archaeon]
MDSRVVQIIDMKMRRIFAMMNYNHEFASHWKAIADEMKKGGREEKEDNFRILYKFFERLLKKSYENMDPEDYAKLKQRVLEVFEFSTDKQYLGKKLRKDWVVHLNKIGGRAAEKVDVKPITLDEAKEKIGKETPKKKLLKWERDKIKNLEDQEYCPNWFERFIEKYALWVIGACGVLFFLLRSFSQ